MEGEGLRGSVERSRGTGPRATGARRGLAEEPKREGQALAQREPGRFRGLNQLDVSHLRAVAFSEFAADDSRVSAIPVLIARPDFVK